MKFLQLVLLFCLTTVAQAQQKNVVLIIADDLGTDYLGFYEDHIDTAAMPNIRALLKKGVRFQNAWSNPICSPTRAGMLTGRYSFRTGVGTAVGGTEGGPSLPMTEKTLPQVLEAFQPNIQKANIGKWHLHGAQPANLMNPNLLGYDHYSGLFIGALPDYYNWTKVTNGVSSNVTTYATTETVNDAIAWTSAQTNPFFLWLAFNAPHTPFHLPPAGLHSYTNLSGTAQDIAQNPKPYYKASLEALDHEIGRLFASLKAQGKFDNTDFIFIGDNGDPQQVAQNTNPARSKGTIYQNGVRIPMIIAGPSVANPGRVSGALVNTVDLFSTILELFGYANWPSQIAASKPVDSKSLMPLLKEECTETRAWAFSEIFKPTTDAEDGKTMRNRDFKLLKFDNGNQEFYNLSTDPAESNNLLLGTLTAVQRANFNFLSNEIKKLTGIGAVKPQISAWLRNLTGIKGRHYLQGNPTPVQDNVLANVQSVKYSANWVYVEATGIPSYITGPFLDGNPSLATVQTGFFKFPLNPVQNTGTPTATTGGNIGAFINGVALFDYRDGVAWNPTTNALCGGPGNPTCPGGPGTAQAWNRDAVLAERRGFDCAKGHPAMGNYHHHQNPSAFNLDLTVASTICDVYLADGLYKIDSTKHSPLIGFAYDGFPIYGAYGYKNVDGTGGIVRIKSGYSLRNITVRTHYADGTDVADGPAVSTTYPLGYFREDYGYTAGGSDVLDVHNGRFCITPEYPNGTYAYFATVNSAWNSAYPYAVGPTFYGTKTASKVTSITETVTTYTGEPLAAATAVCQIACYGGATGEIKLFVNGGTAPYSFNWGGGVVTQNRSGLVAGNYTVTITDAVGQTTTQTATVTQPATSISASATATDIACFGGSTGAITLTATGGSTGFSFLWNDGSKTQNRTDLSAGVYVVTISDEKGCTTTVSKAVSQPQNALAAAANSTAVACFGNATGAISLSVSGGTAGYSFLWNDGNVAQNRTSLAAGTYFVTISDANNCTTTLAKTISQPQTALAATANSTAVACFGNATGAISLSVSGGTAGYSFLWNDGSIAQNKNALAAGSYSATVTDMAGCTATIVQSVSQPQTALAATATGTDLTCFGNATGAISLSISGGTAGYSFLWNDGNLSPNRTALAAGAYSATVTDAQNCTATVSKSLAQPTEILTNSTSGNATCGQPNGSLTLSVSGGVLPYFFNWSTGASTQNLGNLTAGTYFLTVTDGQGCTKTGAGSVSNMTAATANLTATPATCFGGANGSLNLQIAGGTAPFSFLWNDGSTLQNRTNLKAGDYFVTILDGNRCATVVSKTVEQPTAIGLNGTSIPAACGRNNGSILMNIGGGIAPFSFAWSNGSAVQNPSSLAAATYSLTATDANGCTAETSVLVNNLDAPTASATAVPAKCFGGATGEIGLSIEGGALPFSVIWSNGSTNQTGLTGLTAGDYSATILDANGCTATVSQIVSQPAAAFSAAAIFENVKCFGEATGAIELNISGGTAGYSFLWNNGSTAQNRSNLAFGNYTVTVTDANGCTTEIAQTISQPSAISVNVMAMNIACFGNATGEILLDPSGGTAPFLFKWSDGSTVQNRLNLAAGTFSATISDVNGCTLVTSQSLTQPAAALAVTTTTTASTTANDGMAEASATGGTPPFSFLWSNGVPTNRILNLATGNYSVTVTDANGCTTTGVATVDFITSVASVFGEIGLNIFPNPVSDMLIVQTDGLLKKTLQLRITGENGQILMKNELPAGSTICIFDTQILYEGVYFLTVSDGVTEKAFRVVVAR